MGGGGETVTAASPTTPTPEDLSAAVRGGAKVRMGLPIRVEMGDRGVASLDLVARARGDPDPWVVTRIDREIVDMMSSSGRGFYVSGMPPAPDDFVTILRALAAAPTAAKRHWRGANRTRREAGRIALTIQDAMIRGRILDHVDGWSAIEDGAKVIDEDAANGKLIEPDPAVATCRILIVRCPSTSRVYALRVPAEMATAKEARLWTLGDGWSAPPEVET